MPSILEIVAIMIAVLSLIITFLNFRDKRGDKAEKNLEDKIKASMLADTATLKSTILAEATAISALEIKELQNQAKECEVRQAILEERLQNEISLLEKMEEKIDKISEKLNG